jgi:hypothetical protein
MPKTNYDVCIVYRPIETEVLETQKTALINNRST